MPDTTVKLLHSAMTGAPVLSGTAGALVALLDACLVNGFGSNTVDSVVIAGGIGTITRGAGLPFEAGSVAVIGGATVTGGTINGERKIIAATSTTATFDATGLANQTATGTITARLAALGWAKTYAGTNLAAYKPTDVTATGNMLRVDDTGTTSARVRGFVSMVDVNTGVGQFPIDSQVNGGLYWPKSASADTVGRGWVLVGDGRTFYLLTDYSTTAATTFGFNAAFGDLVSVKSPDAYGTFIHGFTSSSFGTAGNNTTTDFEHGDANAAAVGTYLARGYTAIGGSIQARRSFPLITGSTGAKSGNVGLPFPNGADGGVYVAPVNIVDHATGVFRGAAPGLVAFPQSIGALVFASRDYLSGVAGYAGKTFRVVNSSVGCFAFDATGPWR